MTFQAAERWVRYVVTSSRPLETYDNYTQALQRAEDLVLLGEPSVWVFGFDAEGKESIVAHNP